MAKSMRVSLANKCQLLFGAAVVLILTAALAVVWLRLQALVYDNPRSTASKLAEGWLSGKVTLMPTATTGPASETRPRSDRDMLLLLVEKDDFPAAANNDPFLAAAIARFEQQNEREYFQIVSDEKGKPYYQYARAIRRSDQIRVSGSAGPAPGLANPVQRILYIQFRISELTNQLVRNRIYIVAAGLLAGLLAIGTFWFITMRIILSPVRVLRDTAAKVSEGDLNIRSDINTGDEFEQLSDMFNHMLETLKSNQEKLRGVNKSLDLKLGELATTNVALYEANKIKGEFLANVSHELRTPLNSIIGFAEVLEETLRDTALPVDEKRKRYIANIINSSRRLLDLITDLLDLAKIEAGRMEVHVAAVSIADTAEGLVNLIRPQAEKKQIDLGLKIDPGLPVVQTDPGKLQQVAFNFLSNAIKFSPPGGQVTLSAGLVPHRSAMPAGTRINESIPGEGSGYLAEASNADSPRLRLSVSDTGPGIPVDQHARIFEKFTQLDSTVTREFGGTGLGLTISNQLASLLQGQIIVESDTGQGATFHLVLPLTMESRSVALMPNLTDRAKA